MMHRRQLLQLGLGLLALPSRAFAEQGPDFSPLAGFCDGVAPVDEAEYAARRERARGLLAQAGFTALACESGVTQRWLTGTRWGVSERPLIYVLPVDGEPTWVGPAFEEGTLSERVSHGVQRPWHEDISPYTTAAEVVTGKLALDPDMRLFVADGLREATGEAQLAADLFRSLRLVKTPAELARLERANEATKAAFAVVAPHVQPGVDEATVKQWMREAQQAAGLTDVWVLALAGPSASYPHGTREQRVLGKREMMLIDTGGSLHGYRSDITRSWVPGGKASKELRRVWDTVHQAQAAALAAIRPGVEAREPDRIARQVMADAGFGGAFEQFTHRLGHGIGVQVHEPPYLVGSNPLVLGPGMTFSNEPGLYVRDAFGCRLEDIVQVTEDGARVLGPQDNDFGHPGGSSLLPG